jgi:hypothetical protein
LLRRPDCASQAGKTLPNFSINADIKIGWLNMRFIKTEFRRIHEEMCQAHQNEVPHHRAFGDALALCLVGIVGFAMLLTT